MQIVIPHYPVTSTTSTVIENYVPSKVDNTIEIPYDSNQLEFISTEKLPENTYISQIINNIIEPFNSGYLEIFILNDANQRYTLTTYDYLTVIGQFKKGGIIEPTRFGHIHCVLSEIQTSGKGKIYIEYEIF